MWHTSRGRRTLRGAEAELIATAIDMMIDDMTIWLDDVEDGIIEGVYESGVPLFDTMTTSQRIGSLYRVAHDLLTDAAPTPEPSAAAEATVAAIFQCVQDHVAIEIDWQIEEALAPLGSPEASIPAELTTPWRRRVLAAVDELRRGDENDEAWQSGWTPPDDQRWVGDDDRGIDDDDRRIDGGDRWVDGGDGGDADEHPVPPDADCVDNDRWALWIEYLADAILWDRDFELAEDFLDADPRVSRRRRQLLGIRDDYFTRVPPDPKPSELTALISDTRALVRAKPR